MSALLDDLAALVECESPSSDVDACRRCAGVLTGIAEARIGVAPELLDAGGAPALRWRFGVGPTRVLLVGHLDTVWPLGTLAELPFRVEGGRATGPGVFDMKAGLVQGIHALARFGAGELDGVTLLVTSDEEIGSLGSRSLIEAEARGALAALVLEPSAPGGALKTARKGVGMYSLAVRGRAAHAGLEPEKGVSALVELAHQVLALGQIARPDVGTTVTPTVARAGTVTNVVPEEATVHVDVRCATVEEQERVDVQLRSLAATLDGASLEVSGGPNRPPMPVTSSAELFALATRLSTTPLEGVEVGGGSDGNFTAGVGTPTLDGLGAVGDGAHARHEWVDVDAMPQRIDLVAAMVQELLAR
jgi:glutamate carboxypeptidase